MSKIAFVLSAFLSLGAGPISNDPRINGDWPPHHYTHTTEVRVKFVVSWNELETECGAVPPPNFRAGCTRADAQGIYIVVPHPDAILHKKIFPLLLAHELAHVNSWPATHGD